MIGNEIIAIIIAMVLGYLLGSIPSAYIAARLIKGKDIRQMGGGNVGALNTMVEVGRGAGIAVLLADAGKGAAAVAIAQWLLNVPLGAITIAQHPLGAPETFVLLAGIAAMGGHNWSVFLRFTGGKGLATSLGILAVLMPRELLIVLAIVIIPILITRNVALSMSIGFVSVPICAWFLEKSGLLVAFSIVLLLGMGTRFLPTARAAWAKSNGVKDFIHGH